MVKIDDNILILAMLAIMPVTIFIVAIDKMIERNTILECQKAMSNKPTEEILGICGPLDKVDK